MPESEGAAYARTILDRFDNPFMEHRLESIALNSVSKWRARLLPSAVDFAARHGRAPQLIAFSLAALVHRYTTVAGLQDDAPVLEAFRAVRSPAQAMADPGIWGGPLPAIPGFPEAVAAAFGEIRAVGMAAALERAVARSMKRLVLLDARDSVAVAVDGLDAFETGECLGAGTGERLDAVEAIPRGHKIALADLPQGTQVVKYGLPIGVARADIPAGAWVHSHNLESGLHGPAPTSRPRRSPGPGATRPWTCWPGAACPAPSWATAGPARWASATRSG